MKYLVSMIIVFIVPEVLNRITLGPDKTQTKSLKSFVMRPHKDIAFVGKILSGFIIIVFALGVILDQIDGFVLAGGLSMFALGALLMRSWMRTSSWI